MIILNVLFIAFLFFIFTPGTIFTISKKISKINNTIVHAILFSLILNFSQRIFYKNINENFNGSNNANYPLACNSINLGLTNENNYTCIKNNDYYEWVKYCNGATIGEINELGEICNLNIVGDINNYNWTNKIQ
jgi:hypothetical protein